MSLIMNVTKNNIRAGLTQYACANGWTLSVSTNPMTYSDGKTTCEIAIFDPQDNYYTGDVFAYVDINKVDVVLPFLADGHADIVADILNDKDQ